MLRCLSSSSSADSASERYKDTCKHMCDMHVGELSRKSCAPPLYLHYSHLLSCSGTLRQVLRAASSSNNLSDE
jgi:hypothetical protein